MSCPQPTAHDQRDLVTNAFFRQEAMDLYDAVFDRHCDVLLGYVRRRSRPAVSAIEMYYVTAGRVAAHGNHVHVVGRRHLGGDQGPPVYVLDPVHVLLMVFDGVNAMKREG